MATRIYDGSLLRITIDGDTVYHATDSEISIELGTKERATKDTSGVEVAPDLISWTASCNALMVHDTTETGTHAFDALFDLMLAKSLVAVEFTLGSATSGDIYYTGNAYITSLSANATVREDATASISLTGSGEPAKATVA